MGLWPLGLLPLQISQRLGRVYVGQLLLWDFHPESLENKLNGALVEWEKMYGAEPSEKSLAMRFVLTFFQLLLRICSSISW